MKTLYEVVFFCYFIAIGIPLLIQGLINYKFKGIAQMQREIQNSREMNELAKSIAKNGPFYTRPMTAILVSLLCLAIAIFSGIKASISIPTWIVFALCVAGTIYTAWNRVKNIWF